MKADFVVVPGLGVIAIGGKARAKKKAKRAAAKGIRQRAAKKTKRAEAWRDLVKSARRPTRAEWKNLYAHGACGTERATRRKAARASGERRAERMKREAEKLRASAEAPCAVAKKRRMSRAERRALYSSGACGVERDELRAQAGEVIAEKRTRARDQTRREKQLADRPCRRARQKLKKQSRAARLGREERWDKKTPAQKRAARRALERVAETIDAESYNVEGLHGSAAAELFRRDARTWIAKAKKTRSHPYELFSEYLESHPGALDDYAEQSGDARAIDPDEAEYLAELEREARRVRRAA